MKKHQSKIEKLISELCPNGVEFKMLGELEDDNLIKLGRGNVISKTDITNTPGDYPVYSSSANDEGEFGRYGKYMFDDERITWSIDGGGRFFYRQSHKYSVTNVSGWLKVNDNNVLNLRYLYFVLSNAWLTKVFDYTKKAHPSVIREEYKIPIPPLAIQEEIVKILNSFTELEAELEAELEVRKKQYDYYHKELFDLRDDFELKTLGDIYEFQYGEGNTIPTSGDKFPVYGSNGIVGSHEKFNSEDAPVIGHIGAYAGIVNWAQGKHFVTYNGVICKIKPGVNPRFGYHLLILQDFRSKANAGSQPFVSYDMLRKTEVKIPPILIQNKIADVLDKFDALVNDISVGLPAELKARRSQYEYYRNKLLDFKELEK